MATTSTLPAPTHITVTLMQSGSLYGDRPTPHWLLVRGADHKLMTALTQQHTSPAAAIKEAIEKLGAHGVEKITCWNDPSRGLRSRTYRTR